MMALSEGGKKTWQIESTTEKVAHFIDDWFIENGGFKEFKESLK